MKLPTTQPLNVRRLTISVRGVVQGVGFRPFVYNTARSLGLVGYVLNEADMVRIEVQGKSNSLDAFLDLLRDGTPPQARVDELTVEQTACDDDVPTSFEIRPSEIRHSLDRAAPGPTIPADLATCEECRAEILDSSQRRHGYPFTNCTNCGPRWSIIERLPMIGRGPR